jgi:glycosyltransferase involved in cell wall biosynthesis
VVGTSGEAGRVVPFRDPAQLAEAITELCSLPHERVTEMGRAARRRVERVFSWREAAGNTADVLAEVVRAHGRSR